MAMLFCALLFLCFSITSLRGKALRLGIFHFGQLLIQRLMPALGSAASINFKVLN